MDNPLSVASQATIYPDSVRIYIPNQPFTHESKKSFAGQSATFLKKQSLQDEIYENNKERSIRRSRKAIKDYVRCNDFDLFCTFTLKDDRYNDIRNIQRMKTWFKNQRDRNGKFKYIAVTERHKDGALHFHALLGSYEGQLTQAIDPNNGSLLVDKYNIPIYNIDGYTHGISTAKPILDIDSKTRTAFYIQKYLGKDLTAAFGKNRYWASKGLRKPVVQDNPTLVYEDLEPAYKIRVDHGIILEYIKGQHKSIDAFIKENQP